MLSRSRTAAASLVWVGSVLPAAVGQTAAPAAPATRTEAIAANARGVVAGRLNLDTLDTTVGPRAIPKVGGVAAPGLKMTLDGAASSGGRVWYRWIQTQGARVSIRGADQAAAEFVVPADSPTLGFVLVVGNNVGVDARAVAVEVESTEPDEPAGPLRADAGKDQVGSMGRRVTLDGAASEPKGRIRHRWAQVGGPRVADLATNGASCSFVPEANGTYQFALLVVGADGLVSDPAIVKVRVKAGHLAPAGPGPASATAAANPPGSRPAMPLDELARTAVLSIDGGARLAPDLAQAFDVAADRIELFKTYLEAGTETTRRLDAVVPRDPDRRAEWTDRFFKPWTTRLGELMQPEGLDIEAADGPTRPLTRKQRALLAEQFRITAAGLRAGLSLR